MISKTEINRLGRRISRSGENVTNEDLESLQLYRNSFQDSIADVFGFLSVATRKIDKNSIVTYRIKRLDTIIRKLQRFSNNPNGPIELSRMGDIAGCRCILNSTDESLIYKVVSQIELEYGPTCVVKDYVKKPQSSGYRSVHIYVKDKNHQQTVEIQIRNRNQHNWATLVEIIDLLYGTSIKEGDEDNQELVEFLKLYSMGNGLSSKEFVRLIQLENTHKIFENMSSTLTKNYIKVYSQWVSIRSKGPYYVIEASEQGSWIQSYKSFDVAESAYYDSYMNNNGNNIVLTHIKNATFEGISMAYSNYMLSMHSFFSDYRQLIAKKIIECARENKLLLILKEFQIFRRNTVCHLSNLKMEIDAAQKLNNLEINKKQFRNWRNSIESRIKSWSKETLCFIKSLARVSSNKKLCQIVIRIELKLLQKAINKV